MSRRAHSVACLTTSAFTTFAILFLLRATNTIATEWLYVFLPVYIGLLLFLGAPWYYWCDWHDHTGEPPPVWSWEGLHYAPWIKFYLSTLAPAVVFVVLLHLKLAFDTLSAWQVMLPLWYFDCVALVYATYKTFEYRQWLEPVWLPGWLLIFAPLCIFKILLALKLDGGVTFSWIVVASPLFLDAALLLALGAGLTAHALQTEGLTTPVQPIFIPTPESLAVV